MKGLEENCVRISLAVRKQVKPVLNIVGIIFLEPKGLRMKAYFVFSKSFYVETYSYCPYIFIYILLSIYVSTHTHTHTQETTKPKFGVQSQTF